MISVKLTNKLVDLDFSIKDKIISGKPLKEDLETEGIAKLILKNLNEYPDFVGQINVQTGENTTFAQYKDRSIRCALWLKKQGIGKGDVVCTSIPLQDDDYVPCLATLFIGAIINPWHHRLTLPMARYFFDLIQPKVMFAGEESIDLLVTAAKEAGVDCKFVVVGKHANYPSLRDLMAQQSQEEVDEFRHTEPEDAKKQVGAILFSSGTTGNPKGAMLSYEVLQKNRYHYKVPRNNLNLLLYSSFSWITGISFFTTSIRQHLTRILHKEFDPEETAAVMEKYKVNLSFLTPTMLAQMCRSNVFEKYNFSQLDTIILSGCKPSRSILAKARKALPHTLISSAFGMTEAGGQLVLQTRKCQTADSIGRIVGSAQLKIIDPDTGDLRGTNEEGELCFKVENMMMGYLKNPEETKKMLDDEGWLHSGDLGFYDEKGEIWITDRIKQLIIVQNNHVSPTQIEEILLQHPGVADAAVVPVPHKIDVERPLAFVVKKPGAEVTAEELKELPVETSECLRLTGGVVFVDEIPYIPNGKKCTKVLKELALAYGKVTLARAKTAFFRRRCVKYRSIHVRKLILARG